MYAFAGMIFHMASFKPKPVRPVRSDAQIQRQLEARVSELEAEAHNRRRNVVCRDCKYARGIYCINPLIMGFGAPVFQGSTETDLCGPEKALWREKLGIWDRFLEWVVSR